MYHIRPDTKVARKQALLATGGSGAQSMAEETHQLKQHRVYRQMAIGLRWVVPCEPKVNCAAK